MSTLQVQLFGDFQIRYEGSPLAGFDAPRLQSLLTYLLLHRDAPQSRKHLAFQLWPDSSEKQAQGNLRALVHRLKHALPDSDRFLLSDAQTLRWRADAPFTLDVAKFQELTTEKRMPTAPELAAQHLSTAVSLYRGDLLPACYDDWLLPEREHLREMFVDALAQLVALAEAARDFQSAIRYARRLLQADPLREEAYRKLMQLYARTGDRANVVRTYQTCVAVLKRELDAPPGALTRETFAQLRGDETPIERAIVPRTQMKPHLPVPLTSFVGRTRELGAVRTLLERARLVTLTGMGGCGKTRLALQAARAATDDFPDGVWFVDFAPLSDAASVPNTCASVFGLRDQAGTSAIEMLMDYTRDQELLLVLDNCEHLLAACSALAQIILETAPRVRILATSREPLTLSGEALLVVPPLSLPEAGHPTLESVAQSDAVQLFTTRAGFAFPTFNLNQENIEAVAQICRRLDGIPLAIELAAARVRTLTLSQIAARLNDALAVLTRGSSRMPARHQTMRAVLDWSDALLSDPERILFRRLSVFAGGFTLEAAEQICTDHPPLPASSFILHPSAFILDLLSNLIDKSLVTTLEIGQGDEARYRLLEPIRQYAREKLNAAGERETMAARHLNYFMQLAEQAELELTGPQQGLWLERLEAEHDNLRAALSSDVEGNAEQRLRMAGALWRFWQARGNIVEGQKFLTDALDQSKTASTGARAKGYGGLGAIAWLRGAYAEAINYHAQSLALYREIADTHGIALALASIGGSHVYQAEYDNASIYFEESLALARGIGDPFLLSIVLTALGELARYRGDYARAQALNEEARAVATEMQNLSQIALSLNNLGLVATRQGDFTRAVRLHQESLELYRTGGEIRFVPECLEGLATALSALGQPGKAALLVGASNALRASIDLPVPPIERRDYERLLERLRADLGDSFQTEFTRGHAMTMAQAIDLALDKSNQKRLYRRVVTASSPNG